MEHLLTKNEADVLDIILKTIQGKEFMYVNQLPPFNKDHLSRHRSVKFSAYSEYISILENFKKIINITQTESDNYLFKPTSLTKEFYDNGGFRSLYEKQQKELIETKKIEEIKRSNLFLENEEKRFRVKRQKTLYILTIIGSAVTVIGLIIAVIKIFLEK
jgi:hypothetical protein